MAGNAVDAISSNNYENFVSILVDAKAGNMTDALAFLRAATKSLEDRRQQAKRPRSPRPEATAHVEKKSRSDGVASKIQGDPSLDDLHPLDYVQSADTEEYSVVILIPSWAIGNIIGRAGANVKHDRTLSGAGINIPKDDGGFFTGYKEVTLTGTIKAIHQAAHLLSERVQASIDREHAEYHTLRMLVPNALAGFIIGKAGVIVKKIHIDSGATLRIEAERDMRAGQVDRLVHISGEARCRAKALYMISEILKKNKDIVPRRESGSIADSRGRSDDSRRGYSDDRRTGDLPRSHQSGLLPAIDTSNSLASSLLAAQLAASQYDPYSYELAKYTEPHATSSSPAALIAAHLAALAQAQALGQSQTGAASAGSYNPAHLAQYQQQFQQHR